MAKNTNRGLEKRHLVRDASGAEFEMTQEEWKNRDKQAGLERIDVVEPAVVEDTTTEEVPVDGTPTPTE